MDGWPALAIHGDKTQPERDWVLQEFRNGTHPLMIATDVAARGLGTLSFYFFSSFPVSFFVVSRLAFFLLSVVLLFWMSVACREAVTQYLCMYPFMGKEWEEE